MTPLAHYTARALPGRHPFANTALARSFWTRLKRAFPNAIAVALMPHHVHMVAPDGGLVDTRVLGKLLSAVARASPRWTGRGRWWEPVEAPGALPTTDKVMRVTRYAWLNPCRPWSYRGHRIQLTGDPLRWSWSTLRDTVGAIADPWVPAERLAVAFGWAIGDDLAERLHTYATRDDHVGLEARSFPVRRPTRPAPSCTVDAILRAALATTRLPPEALRQRTAARRVAAGLAYDQGWSHPRQLAPVLDVHPKTAPRLARSASPGEVRAAAPCLEPRLHVDPETNLREANVEPE